MTGKNTHQFRVAIVWVILSTPTGILSMAGFVKFNLILWFGLNLVLGSPINLGATHPIAGKMTTLLLTSRGPAISAVSCPKVSSVCTNIPPLGNFHLRIL